jgi:tetratricopeptide (TPR) repeat protein
MRARGDLSGSLAGNRRALALFQQILDADPRNVQAMRDVALSYSKTAELQAAMGRIDAALADAQVALARFEALAQADATNATAQADVASSLSVIGDLLLKRGDTQGALARFERMTAIAERLAAKDATNSESQYAVAIAYSQMGEAWAARGGRAALARARDYYARSAGLFADLKDKGALTGSDADQPGRIAAQIARLDRQLKP